MITISKKKYTLKEYFELEKPSEVRHEFIFGQLIPRSSESKDANKIALNIFSLLQSVLEAQGYEIFLHDVRTMVKESEIYRYPDLVVAPETDNSDTHAITQPVLIVEVISEGTANTDRGEKLQEYCSLPTLQYYLIIEQKQKLIEMYSKEDNQWVLRFFDEKTPSVFLTQFNISLTIDGIYKKVKFGK